MNKREEIIVDLQDGSTVIGLPRYQSESHIRERLNRILTFFGVPEITGKMSVRLGGRYATLICEPFKKRSWSLYSSRIPGTRSIDLDDAYDVLFDENYFEPTIENLRAGRCAVSWVGRPPIALFSLIALAFPEDCISGLGYREGPISNDPEHDGEWDHFPDFPGPIYHLSLFKKDFDRVAYTFTEKTNRRHDKNKNLPFRQVETAPQFNPEYFLQRDSHTGTQLAETISDFDEQVKRVVRQLLLE
jgi:hypothetical protein